MKNFSNFYLHYLLEHSNPATRRMHVFAQLATLSSIALSVVFGYFHFIPFQIAIGYIAGWYSHWRHEKNVPTTFSEPMWSLRAGRYMLRAILRGDINLTGHAYEMFENGYLKRIADGIPSQEET
jgi:hypothetical protein